MKTKYKPTKKIAQKVLETVDMGLVNGLGVREPGKMCVEAAVCFAFGLPHGDNPPCVGKVVRDFKISLNDCKWPSDAARTKGMRKLAVAQLGSDTIDQTKFLEIVGFKCITRILPVILENALKEDTGKKYTPKDEEVLLAIDALKGAKDFETAKVAARKAREIYASASASASAYASAYASASAYAYASASAYASAYASASAYAYASAYAEKMPDFNLKILTMTAEVGLEALQELKSPGCKWLYLCDL